MTLKLFPSNLSLRNYGSHPLIHDAIKICSHKSLAFNATNNFPSPFPINPLTTFKITRTIENTHKSVAPQPSMSVRTTQQTETTGSPFMNTSRGLLMLIGISSGTGLVLINILLIACCLHKRHKKNLKGGK